MAMLRGVGRALRGNVDVGARLAGHGNVTTASMTMGGGGRARRSTGRRIRAANPGRAGRRALRPNAAAQRSSAVNASVAALRPSRPGTPGALRQLSSRVARGVGRGAAVGTAGAIGLGMGWGAGKGQPTPMPQQSMYGSSGGTGMI